MILLHFECINEQEKYWINQVNDARFYLENMFQDFDFLDLHKFIDVYRFNPDFAENAFGINFSDYSDLMPDDIKEEFNKELLEPIPSTEPYKAKPVLDEAEYQRILKIMRSMSLVIERSPSSFVTLDEEAIRTHFLLQLNGHYEGGASGETFNASGKTDILIRADNRNIFIAECKFWKGQKVFNDAIDQLLGYLSWRDTKCALLIFNKTKDTSSVRNKMHLAMESRSENRKTVFYSEDGDSRYIFVKKDEPGREIIITTQIYDIPTTLD